MVTFIVILSGLIAGFAATLWFYERRKARYYENQAQKILKIKNEDANGWADSYKSINQKLNGAYARIAADKPMVELGKKHAVTMAKSEAKRKMQRALATPKKK